MSHFRTKTIQQQILPFSPAISLDFPPLPSHAGFEGFVLLQHDVVLQGTIEIIYDDVFIKRIELKFIARPGVSVEQMKRE